MNRHMIYVSNTGKLYSGSIACHFSEQSCEARFQMVARQMEQVRHVFKCRDRLQMSCGTPPG